MKLVATQMFGTLQSAFKKDFPIYVLIASYITISTLVAYRIGFLDNFSLLIYPGLTLRALAILSALSIGGLRFLLDARCETRTAHPSVDQSYYAVLQYSGICPGAFAFPCHGFVFFGDVVI